MELNPRPRAWPLAPPCGRHKWMVPFSNMSIVVIFMDTISYTETWYLLVLFSKHSKSDLVLQFFILTVENYNVNLFLSAFTFFFLFFGIAFGGSFVSVLNWADCSFCCLWSISADVTFSFTRYLFSIILSSKIVCISTALDANVSRESLQN